MIASILSGAFLLGQIFIWQPNFVPVPVPIAPQQAPAAEPDYLFQPADDPWAFTYPVDFPPVNQTDDQAGRNRRVAVTTRQQRLALYDASVRKLSDISMAMEAGESGQADQLGEVRATLGAIQSTAPSSPVEQSSLTIATTSVANAEVAERRDRDEQAQAEIRRALVVLAQAQQAAATTPASG